MPAQSEQTTETRSRAVERSGGNGAAPCSVCSLTIDEFRRAADPTGFGLRWVIGNALSAVADDSVFDEIAALAQDRSYGKACQMVVLSLARD